ncbi:hypothetical protein D9M70_491060 [compost metagenome]
MGLMQARGEILFLLAGHDPLQTGLRIDQELAGGDDRLSFLQAGQHLQAPIGLAAQGDFMGAVASVAFGQHHQRTLASADHCLAGHQERGLLGFAVQAHGGEHAGAQLASRVG